jgi:hypothetical protein
MSLFRNEELNLEDFARKNTTPEEQDKHVLMSDTLYIIL